MVVWLLACGGDVLQPAAGETEEHRPTRARVSSAAVDAVSAGSAGVRVQRELLNALGVTEAPWMATLERRGRGVERSAHASMPSGQRGAPREVAVELPDVADRPFSIRPANSSFGVAVRLVGAEPVARRSIGGLEVYPAAAGNQATLVLRPSSAGIEDFIAFPVPPPAPEVHYRVELEAEVSGLRLVARTLEFLDATGTPRLRIAPPEVMSADGAIVNAELAVLDCALDESPASPWGRAPVPPGADACTVRVSWPSDGVVYPALLDPAWVSTATLSVARAHFSSQLLPNGRVLAAGGVSGSSEAPTGAAELYDPATESWAVTGSLDVARSAFTLSPHPMPDANERVIAVGGLGLEGPLASSEVYDPATGTWSLGPALPAARAGHGAATLESGVLLVAGGTTREATWLAPGGERWERAGALLADEPVCTLTALQDGGALLVGPNAPVAQRYDAVAHSWRVAGTEAGGPALPRAGHSATRLLDGRVLLVGGHGSQSIELYDPASDGFGLTGATSMPHVGHTATRLDDGRVAVIGGLASGSAGGAEIYDPTWGTWVPGPGTATTRFAHRAELLGDGRLLSFGGFESGAPESENGEPLDAPLASAEKLDATRPAVTIGEYRLPARIDPDITASTATELWASVTRPATLVDGERYPLVLFLHGNHATCGFGENPRQDSDCLYTLIGICPGGYVVVPSHRGYDYATTELAARGYVVVSVNANRGINCGNGEDGDFGFNLARGRLLLAHLRQLAEWNRGVSATPESLGVSLEGKLDFAEVGMMGHSRGGEGVRAAYQQYRDAESPWPGRIGPVTFRALFEIGAVDGQTSRVLDADGTAWTALLPMCDGDVSNLEGVKPFDRMLGLLGEARDCPKSTYVAWGANHNYFNTEWQQSDSPGCDNHRPLFAAGPTVTGSAEQRQIALRSLLAFFLANVGRGRNPVLNELFDPTSPLESGTRIDRGHTPSLRPSRGITLEDFSARTGLSARGLPLGVQNVLLSHESVPEHDLGLRSALVEWTATTRDPPGPSEARFLELPLSARPEGIDLGDYTHLEFRAGRAQADDLLAPSPLHVQLVNADGSASDPLDASAFGLRLDGPVGGPFNTHVVLQTARIPLAAFEGGTRQALRGVRFGFPDANGARLHLANVRASLGSASLSPRERARASAVRRALPIPIALPELGLEQNASVSPILPGTSAPVPRQRTLEGNRVLAIRAVEAARIELELASVQPFQARGDQLVLALDQVQSARSRHPDGDLTRAVFTFEASELAGVPNGTRILVRYGANDAREWDFGRLDKSLLTP
jgi:hypothetical protein